MSYEQQDCPRQRCQRAHRHFRPAVLLWMRRWRTEAEGWAVANVLLQAVSWASRASPQSELDWQPGSSILAGGSESVRVSVGGAFRCLDLDLHPLDLGSNLQELSLPPQVF